MRTLKAGTSGSRGFTFIEITMVLLILALFLSLSVPRLVSFVSSGKLENSVSRLSVYIEHLRDLSIYRQEALILHCNLDTGKFWVTKRDGEASDSVLLRPLSFPESVKVAGIIVNNEKKVIDGEAEIAFYPGGKAKPSLIYLKSETEEEITLEIPYLSRNVKLHEGYLETI